MAHDTQSSWNVKDSESNNSIGRHIRSKGSSASGSSTSDTSGLRRSSKETLSKKNNPPSPRTRKSERLEKQIPETPPAKRKSKRLENKLTPSPLWRSERGNTHSSTSSASKRSLNSSSSSPMQKKREKKEKIVKELTLGTTELRKTEKQIVGSMNVKNAHKYMDILQKKNRKKIKLSDVTAKQSGDRLPLSSCNAITINDAPEMLVMDCSAMGKLKTPELASSLNGRIPDVYTGSEGSEYITPLKRKRNMVDGDSDSSAVNASTLVVDAVPSVASGRPGNVSVETCSVCFKQQRVDNDQTKHELCSCKRKLNLELSGAVNELDSGEVVADSTTRLPKNLNSRIQQKEVSVDLQTNGEENTCLICSSGGKLLCCDGKGCKRSCHLSCLDPPLNDVPLGAWHCSICVRKKIESGIYSVSEGVESIWGVREVKVSDADGLRWQREYFAKFKGVAHIHNQWVPASKVILEAPSILRKFNKQNQANYWEQEWTVPCRILRKRLLMSSKQWDDYLREYVGDKLLHNCEFLVKWCGLDYEDVTWEFKDASFFNSPKGQALIRDFENRCEKGKKVSFSSEKRCEETVESKKCSLVELSQLPLGDVSGCGNTYLYDVNKLRELWHRGANAVLFDHQELLMKVIAFILSLQSDVQQPFLIISTATSLCFWNNGFLRWAPSTSFVVYSGEEDKRKTIRTLEFDTSNGCIMFDVLITSPEAILEDAGFFESIRWEATIIDDCQRPRISKCLVQFKILHTKMWLLLVSGVIKDSSAEYLDLLSLLDTPCDLHSSGELLTNCSDDIAKLKERFSKYTVNEPSRFVEYWVPVQISNVQRELYCEKLLLNPSLLHFSSAKDLVGALHDLLSSTRKCCDHPYVEEAYLQEKVIEYEGILSIDSEDVRKKALLDAGINASGKLQLLDMMLMEIKKRGLRVVILFQSIGGPGICSIGDILDDFLRQKYGEDSYERLDKDVLLSKKNEAMTKFNNKECGRFVFLLEARACRPSIKLSSVDAIIIFGSDWNPVNDVRALQKMTLDSHSEQIKVFRLYSTCTVEEKVLILAKQDKILDMQHINKSNCQMLLQWGLPDQFVKLNEFHSLNNPASAAGIMPVEPPLKEVIPEFLSILSPDAKDSDLDGFSVISEAHQAGGGYSTKNSLFSELKCQHTGEGKSHNFWMELLEGQHPQWKYCHGSSHRNRKRVKHTGEELAKKRRVESDEAVKKRKKMVDSNHNSGHLKPGFEGKSFPISENGASVVPADDMPRSSPRSSVCVNNLIGENRAYGSHDFSRSIFQIPESNMIESEERRKLLDAQKSLHLLLNPEISKLCGILQLSDSVKAWAKQFLDYIMKNHIVIREPATILQAFQISLCWTVASLLKEKVDHQESFALAKQHLNLNCQKDEADRVYSMMRCLKQTFLYRTGYYKAAEPPNFYELAEKDLSKSINEIQKKFQRKTVKLDEKQYTEKSNLLKLHEVQNVQREEKHRIELAVIRLTGTSVDMVRILERQEKENEEHKQMVVNDLQQLEKMQLKARLTLKQNENQQVEEVRKWVRDELFNRSLSHAPDEAITCNSPVETVMTPARAYSSNVAIDKMAYEGCNFMEKNKSGSSGDVQETVISKNHCAKEQMTNGGKSDNGEVLIDVPVIVCYTDGLQKGIIEEMIHRSDTLPICDGVVRLEEPESASSNDGPLNMLPTDQSPHESVLSVPEREASLEFHEAVSPIHDLSNVVAVSQCASEEQIRVVTENIEGEDIQVESGVVATVSLTNETGVLSVELPSSEELITEKTTEVENSEVHVIASGIATGVNQQNQVDTVISSATQCVAAMVSDHTDHEMRASEPVVPSSETHDCSPQLSSAEELITEKTTEVESSEVHVTASGIATGVNQQNQVDTVISSATQCVEAMVSDHTDHEMLASEPVAPSSETHDCSPQLSSAEELITEKTTEVESSEVHITASGIAMVNQQNQVDTVISSATQCVEAMVSDHTDHEMCASEPVVPSSETHDCSPQLSSAEELITEKTTEVESSEVHVTASGIATGVNQQNQVDTVISSATQCVAAMVSDHTDHEMLASEPVVPSSETHDCSPQLSSAEEVITEKTTEEENSEVHVTATGVNQQNRVDTVVSSATQCVAAMVSDPPDYETLASEAVVPSSETHDCSPQLSSAEELITENTTEEENSEVHVTASGSATGVNQQNRVDTVVSSATQCVAAMVSDPPDHGTFASEAVVPSFETHDCSPQLSSAEELITEKTTEVESSEVHVTASGIATGVNQQNQVDTVISSATQCVAAMVSDHTDHEMLASEPVVPSSETHDCSPQLSSAEELITEKTTEEENSTVNVTASSIATGVNQQNRVDTVASSATQCVTDIVSDPPDQETLASEPVVPSSETHDSSPPQLSSAAGIENQSSSQNQDNDTLVATCTTVLDGNAQGSGKQNTSQSIENIASQHHEVSVLESPSACAFEVHPSVASPSQHHQVSVLESSSTPVEVRPSIENQDRGVLLATSTTVQDGDVVTGNQNTCQPVENHVSQFTATVESDYETPTNATFAQMQFPPTHVAPQGALRMRHPSYPDPLQMELERLNKETEQTIKSYEDKKLHLKFEYDKKVEQKVAELRQQYETALQEEEAEFQRKKREEDSVCNKVLMNMILAEAFRSKCMDVRPSSASGVHQGNPSFVQQLVQLSMQNNAQRGLSVASFSDISLPACSLPTSIAPLPSLQTTLPAPATAASPLYTAPVMRTVPVLPASSPTAAARPPHIGTFSYSTVSPQGGGQVRYPAPHLQPYRPSTSITGTSPLSQQCGMSNHHSHNNAATTSSLPHVLRMPAPTQQTATSSGAQCLNSAERVPELHNSSALELLRNMENCSGANPHNSLLSLPSLYHSHNNAATTSSLPHVPRMPAPTQQTATSSRAQCHSAGRMPELHNSSALELLRNMENGSGANPHDNLLSLPRGSLNNAGSANADMASADPINTSGVLGIVCLSDDD